jgi:Spy/CpxP family protein refolding chaperone
MTSIQGIRKFAAATAMVALTLVPIAAQDAGGTGRGRQGFGPPMGRGGFGPPPGVALERLDRELAFTDAQKTQIQTLLSEQRDAIKTTIASLTQAHQALDAAILQTPEDDAVLQTRVNDVAQIEAQLQLARAKVESEIFQLLTPDQQQRAQQFVAQMQSRRRAPSGQ